MDAWIKYKELPKVDRPAGSALAAFTTRMLLTRMAGCAGFFALYHGTLCSLRSRGINSESDVSNVAIAAGVATAPLLATGMVRILAPYAALLVIMDTYDTYKAGGYMANDSNR